ncbi:MAG: hypothetical protein K2M79_01660 [Muribaculaceae bacterium]|nr:hypothetical protein [Muribaculaceae bacterium]
MMKLSFRNLLYAAGMTVVLCGCGNKPVQAVEEVSPETARAAETGARHGKRAAELPPESYEREEALLDIKARESHLRAAGLNSAADAYIKAAREAYQSTEVSENE